MAEVLVLGIESSCDETAVAIYSSKRGLIANNLHSQITTHQKYGGVVPELASRDHANYILELTNKSCIDANIALDDLNLIAYTAGPGLAGCLLVGASFAKSLAFSLQIDSIAIHHMQGHILSCFLQQGHLTNNEFLVLLVSGGHTMLVLAKSFTDYKILGDTLDDAVGEAFDKTANLMGFEYPGGAKLSNLAKSGDANKFKFPLPMVNRDNLDFSFSGLKTFTRNLIKKHPYNLADISAGFEKTVVEILFAKCNKAIKQTGIDTIYISGGVSANSYLRDKFNSLDAKAVFPKLEYCTDNAAMIAFAGYINLTNNTSMDKTYAIAVKPRWSLEQILC